MIMQIGSQNAPFGVEGPSAKGSVLDRDQNTVVEVQVIADSVDPLLVRAIGINSPMSDCAASFSSAMPPLSNYPKRPQ
jgi:hypothetical protein